jgi:hypothetical protein
MILVHVEAVGVRPAPSRAARSPGVVRSRFRVDIDAGSDKLGPKVRPVQLANPEKNQQLPARGHRPVVAWTEREAHGRRGGVMSLAESARSGA